MKLVSYLGIKKFLSVKIFQKWIDLFTAVSWQQSGHLWRRAVLHRRNSGLLPGQRNSSRYAVRQDVVLFSGTVSEEEPRLESIPPPGPQGMEGDNEEGISGRKELQSSWTVERTRRSVFKEWVSVQVLPGENWGEMLRSRSRIKDLTWLR